MNHVILRALAIALAALLSAGAAFGQEQQAAEIRLAGPAARVESMVQALGGPLGRLPIEVRIGYETAIDPRTVIDGASNHGAAFVRVWIDLGAEERVTLYFVDAAWERILIRHVALEKDFDEVEREEVAQIVRSAVEALMGGAKLGVTREQARADLLPEPPLSAAPPPRPLRKPRPVPPSPPPAARERALGVDVGAFYEGAIYAGELWHGPGVLAGAEERGAMSYGGRFSLQYRTPVEVEGERLGARLQALSLRALGRGAWTSGVFSASAAAGLGLDLTRVEPLAVSSGATADNASWDAVPVARVLAGAGVAAGALWIWPVVGLDVDLKEVRHVGERAGQKYTVFDVSRARPFVGLELVLPTVGRD
jgi:hypothetical protein